MKNKKMTYILFAVVLLVWGSVFYRIFSVSGSKDTAVIAPVAFAATSEKVVMDTFDLIANYRDPFLGKVPVEHPEGEKPKAPPVKKPEQPKPAPVQWPGIVYRGMIMNQKTGKQLYLVTINNQDNMMKPGDVMAEVELKKVFRDSIQVVYKGENKTVKK